MQGPPHPATPHGTANPGNLRSGYNQGEGAQKGHTGRSKHIAYNSASLTQSGGHPPISTYHGQRTYQAHTAITPTEHATPGNLGGEQQEGTMHLVTHPDRSKHTVVNSFRQQGTTDETEAEGLHGHTNANAQQTRGTSGSQYNIRPQPPPFRHEAEQPTGRATEENKHWAGAHLIDQQCAPPSTPPRARPELPTGTALCATPPSNATLS